MQTARFDRHLVRDLTWSRHQLEDLARRRLEVSWLQNHKSSSTLRMRLMLNHQGEEYEKRDAQTLNGRCRPACSDLRGDSQHLLGKTGVKRILWPSFCEYMSHAAGGVPGSK